MPEYLDLLRDLESFRTERTESLDATDKFCKNICAFSNDLPGSSLPGYLFIGVDHNGTPVGSRIEERLLEQLAAHRNNGQILPIPDMHVFKANVGGRDIAVIAVKPSDMPPVRYKQVVYIRTGPTVSIATAEQERRLEERRVDRSATWDLRGCPDATLNDLSLETFKLSYLPRAVSPQVLDENGRDIEDQLGSLRFFQARRRVPTNAAILVFGKDPTAMFPGAYVQYVHYDGIDQASSVLEDQRISGDLLTVMRELDQLARRVARVRPERLKDLSEREVADYPEVALHELFMNAVIHRNYEGSTTPVSINHFSDRIEIINPGSLYGDLTRSQFPDGTSYRNPVVAEAAKTLGFANRFGRGIALAREALRRNGSPDLVYEVADNHMMMKVRRRA